MRKVTGCVCTNKNGSDCHFEFHVDDDATEKEIEELARESMFDLIDWHFDVDPPLESAKKSRKKNMTVKSLQQEGGAGR